MLRPRLPAKTYPIGQKNFEPTSEDGCRLNAKQGKQAKDVVGDRKERKDVVSLMTFWVQEVDVKYTYDLNMPTGRLVLWISTMCPCECLRRVQKHTRMYI